MEGENSVNTFELPELLEMGETIILEGQCMDDGTGVHKVLLVPGDVASQELLDSELALVDDSASASGLNTRNHSGYNPYDRPRAASKTPGEQKARPRLTARPARVAYR